MATTAHGDPKPIDLVSPFSGGSEEMWDQNIEALLASGDIEGARAEFERQCLASLESGDTILMTPAKLEELRTELHRYGADMQDQERESSAEANCGIVDEPRPGRPGHTVDALLDQGNIAEAKTELGRLLLQGMSSVNPVEATPQFFENARDGLRRKSEQLKARKSA
jgi:hypothetical protein